MGCRVDDPAYSAPLLIRAPTVLLFAASGAAVAWAFQAGLGDGTWSISTGIGACMAAAVYEVGRPDRLNPEQAVELESQWQDFGALSCLLPLPQSAVLDCCRMHLRIELISHA